MSRGLGQAPTGQHLPRAKYVPDTVPGALLNFLFKTQPFEWDIFISLLQTKKLKPVEGESFESGHTAGERVSQCWNLYFWKFPLHQATSGTQQGFTLRTKERTLVLSAWLQDDRDPGVNKPLPNIGVNTQVY